VKLDPALKHLITHADVSFANGTTTKQINLIFSSEISILTVFSKLEYQQVQLSFSRKGTDTLALVLPAAPNVTAAFEYVYPLDETDTMIILDRGSRWYPLIADNIAKAKLTVYVPFGYTAVAAGNLKSVDTLSAGKQYVYESRMPIFKIPLVIFPDSYYKKFQKSCNSKHISVYLIPPADSSTAERILSKVCNQIRYFENNIGRYEFDEFKILEVPSFQGSNLGSSIIMTGTQNIRDFEKGYGQWLSLSTAAQWISAGVFPRLFSKGFWFFSISFPHYLRLMYIRDSEGEDSFFNELNQSYDSYKEIAGTDKDIPILEIDMPNTPEKGRVLYGKGVYVLDKVRKLIGDENWSRLVKELYNDFKGKILTYEDFMICLTKYDTGGSCKINLEKMLNEKGLVE
jgi:hypothetical protein